VGTALIRSTLCSLNSSTAICFVDEAEANDLVEVLLVAGVALKIACSSQGEWIVCICYLECCNIAGGRREAKYLQDLMRVARSKNA